MHNYVFKIISYSCFIVIRLHGCVLKMLSIFNNLERLFKREKPYCGTWILQLHYRFTCSVILFACIVLLSTQLTGNPIYCESGSKISKKVLGLYEYCYLKLHISVYIEKKKKRSENSTFTETFPFQ